MSGEDKTAETAASAIKVGSQDFLFKPLIKPLFIKKIGTVLENLLRFDIPHSLLLHLLINDTARKEKLHTRHSCTKRKRRLRCSLVKFQFWLPKTQKVILLFSCIDTKLLIVMKAIETPIEGITRTLSKILQDESLKNLAIKKDLEDIFFMIRTNKDLYAPVIKELLKQEMNPVCLLPPLLFYR